MAATCGGSRKSNMKISGVLCFLGCMVAVDRGGYWRLPVFLGGTGVDLTFGIVNSCCCGYDYDDEEMRRVVKRMSLSVRVRRVRMRVVRVKKEEKGKGKRKEEGNRLPICEITL